MSQPTAQQRGVIYLETRNRNEIYEIENGAIRFNLCYPPGNNRWYYRPGDILFWNYETTRELQRQFPTELGMPGAVTATDCLVTFVFFYTGLFEEVHKIKTGLRLESVEGTRLRFRKVMIFEDGSVIPVGNFQDRSLSSLAQDLNRFGRYFPKDRAFEDAVLKYTMMLVKTGLSAGVGGKLIASTTGKILARNAAWRLIRPRLAKMLKANLSKYFMAVAKAGIQEMIKEYHKQERPGLPIGPLSGIDNRKVVEAMVQKSLSEAFSLFLLPNWMKPLLEGLADASWQQKLAKAAAEEVFQLYFKEHASFFSRHIAILIAHSRDKKSKEYLEAVDNLVQSTPSHVLENGLQRFVDRFLKEIEQ